jgi:hypothetical protein
MELLSSPEVVLDIRGGLGSICIGESGISGALITRAASDVGSARPSGISRGSVSTAS